MDSKVRNAADIQVVRGFPFPDLPWFLEKNIEDAMDYIPKDGDLIITSYPKTGTTWMQYIVMQLVSKATNFSSLDDVTFKHHPYIEMVGSAAVEALTEPRIYKHHLPYNLVQKNAKCKSIYTYRHPEDVVVSFYHFKQGVNSGDPVTFDEFFDNFLTGNIGYGSYFPHVLSIYEHRNDLNILMVSYEKLHANRTEEILRIAKFLGEEYYTCLVEDNSILKQVIEHTSFEYMKKNLFLSHPAKKIDGDGKKTVSVFRKGIVGDGKNVLTHEQRQKLKDFANKTLGGTSILKEWYPDEV